MMSHVPFLRFLYANIYFKIIDFWTRQFLFIYVKNTITVQTEQYTVSVQGGVGVNGLFNCFFTVIKSALIHVDVSHFTNNPYKPNGISHPYQMN